MRKNSSTKSISLHAENATSVQVNIDGGQYVGRDSTRLSSAIPPQFFKIVYTDASLGCRSEAWYDAQKDVMGETEFLPVFAGVICTDFMRAILSAHNLELQTYHQLLIQIYSESIGEKKSMSELKRQAAQLSCEIFDSLCNCVNLKDPQQLALYIGEWRKKQGDSALLRIQKDDFALQVRRFGISSLSIYFKGSRGVADFAAAMGNESNSIDCSLLHVLQRQAIEIAKKHLELYRPNWSDGGGGLGQIRFRSRVDGFLVMGASWTLDFVPDENSCVIPDSLQAEMEKHGIRVKTPEFSNNKAIQP